jgi:hypothetical protein
MISAANESADRRVSANAKKHLMCHLNIINNLLLETD